MQANTTESSTVSTWWGWLLSALDAHPRIAVLVVVAVIVLVYMFVQYRSTLSSMLSFDVGGADKEKELDSLINSIKTKQKTAKKSETD